MISRLFIIKVTPREVCFSRLTLAAMHYNHNSGRKQAVKKGLKKRFSVLFPKYKKGGHIVREIKTQSSYGESPLSQTGTLICILIEFLNPILEEMFRLVKTPARNTNDTMMSQAPPLLSSQFDRPDKDSAIKDHCSRFNN